MRMRGVKNRASTFLIIVLSVVFAAARRSTRRGGIELRSTAIAWLATSSNPVLFFKSSHGWVAGISSSRLGFANVDAALQKDVQIRAGSLARKHPPDSVGGKV